MSNPGTGEVDGEITDALLKTRRFLTHADISDDMRTIHKEGGREGDVF